MFLSHQTARAASAVLSSKELAEGPDTRSQTQQQTRQDAASPKQESGSATSAQSTNRSPPVSPSVQIPGTASTGNKQPSKQTLSENASRKDGVAAAKPVYVVDTSQVSVRVTTVGKEPQPTVVAAAGNVARPPLDDAQSDRGAVANGNVQETDTKSDAKTKSPGPATGIERRLSSAGEERRIKFAGAAQHAVIATASQISELTNEPSSSEADGERVDIKSVDPKMEIFEALNKSGLQTTARGADSASAPKGPATDESKPVPADNGVALRGAPTAGLQRGSVPADQKTDSTAGKSPVKDDQQTVASARLEVSVVKPAAATSTSAAPAANDVLPPKKDAPISSSVQVSPLNSQAAVAEGQGQTNTASSSVTVSTSSLPRPTSALTGIKQETTPPPSSQASKPPGSSVRDCELKFL